MPLLSLRAFVACKSVKPAYIYIAGHAVAQWLRHCATNRKVAGQIPNGITAFFH
jgi:hypothetical protein